MMTIVHSCIIFWENINSGAKAMATHMQRHELPSVVISTQEDVITASLVCNIIKLPLCIVHLDDRQNGFILEGIPKFGMPIRSGVFEQSPLPSVAIISTLIDNNRNVDDLVSYYKVRSHKVKSLCLYTRKNVNNQPDYNWVTLTKSTKYIFPWQEK